MKQIKQFTLFNQEEQLALDKENTVLKELTAELTNNVNVIEISNAVDAEGKHETSTYGFLVYRARINGIKDTKVLLTTIDGEYHKVINDDFKNASVRLDAILRKHCDKVTKNRENFEDVATDHLFRHLGIFTIPQDDGSNLLFKVEGG